MTATPSTDGQTNSPDLPARTDLADPYRMFFERALDLLAVLDHSGRFLVINARWSQVLGYRREELLGQPLLALVHPDDLAAAEAELRAWTVEQRASSGFQSRCRTQAGEYRWLRWSATADETHGTVQLIGRDITGRREAEAALQASEARFRELAQSIPGAVFQLTVRDGAWAVDFISERVTDLAGITPEEAMRDFGALAERVHPDDRPGYIASVTAALEGLTPWQHQARCVLPDGEIRWWHGTSTPRRTPDGGVVFNGILLDITSRKAAEEAVRKQSQLTEWLLTNIGDGVIVVDEHGHVPIFNPAAVRMFGSGAVETEADEWAATYGNFLPDQATPFPTPQLPMVRALQGHASDNVEMFVRHAQNREGSWISVSGRPLRDEHGGLRGGVVVCRDIGDQKRAEEALRQTLVQEEVIRAQQAALAELSTPLIPISDQVMVMPLIGAIDSRRVQQVLDTLLSGVAAQGAEVVILDITGVSVVDTQVANALVRAARSVKLLGARVILTGIRGEVAQTLVSLGVDLSDVITRSTLQSGIALAIRR